MDTVRTHSFDSDGRLNRLRSTMCRVCGWLSLEIYRGVNFYVNSCFDGDNRGRRIRSFDRWAFDFLVCPVFTDRLLTRPVNFLRVLCARN